MNTDISPSYKVLWLEDQPELENAQDFKEQAEDNGFELIIHETVESALNYLKSESGKTIDGLILDVIGKKETGDEQASEAAFSKFLRELPDDYKHLPKLAYSAMTSKIQGENTQANIGLDEITTFTKSQNEEHELLEYLGKEIENAKDPKLVLRNKYRSIYEFCRDNSTMGSCWDTLVSCLLHIECGEELTSGIEPYNAIRQIFENVCHLFNTKGLLPDDLCKKGQLDFSGALYFLAGTHRDYDQENHPSFHEFTLKYISSFISKVANGASHADAGNNWDSEIDEHYILHTLTYATLTFLCEAKAILEANPNREVNKTTYSKNDSEKWIGLTIEKREKFIVAVDNDDNVYSFNLNQWNWTAIGAAQPKIGDKIKGIPDTRKDKHGLTWLDKIQVKDEEGWKEIENNRKVKKY